MQQDNVELTIVQNKSNEGFYSFEAFALYLFSHASDSSSLASFSNFYVNHTSVSALCMDDKVQYYFKVPEAEVL